MQSMVVEWRGTLPRTNIEMKNRDAFASTLHNNERTRTNNDAKDLDNA